MLKIHVSMGGKFRIIGNVTLYAKLFNLMSFSTVVYSYLFTILCNVSSGTPLVLRAISSLTSLAHGAIPSRMLIKYPFSTPICTYGTISHTRILVLSTIIGLQPARACCFAFDRLIVWAISKYFGSNLYCSRLLS